MGDDPPDPLKADLEREKLRLEIAELRRPLWRRATIWASFLPPLTVALLGVGIGVWTGFFDAQRLYLEARTQVLTREEQDLKDRKTGLLAQVGQLQGQVDQTGTNLANERENARVEREKMATDRRDDKAKADKETAALKRTVDENRELAQRSPAVVWLDVMKRKKEPWQLVDTTHAADELLTVLNGNRSLAPLVAADYEKHSGDDLIASKLLRVLYAATGDAQWLEKIAAKLAEAPKAENRPPGLP